MWAAHGLMIVVTGLLIPAFRLAWYFRLHFVPIASSARITEQLQLPGRTAPPKHPCAPQMDGGVPMRNSPHFSSNLVYMGL